MSYAGRTKYDEPGRAARYRERSHRRNLEEWRLLEGLLTPLLAAGARPTVLDVPCGTGRIAERLLEIGLPVRGADLSPAMRAEADQRLTGHAGYRGTVALDLEQAEGPLPGRADLVVCLRLLHPLPDSGTPARVWATLRPPDGRPPRRQDAHESRCWRSAGPPGWRSRGAHHPPGADASG